MPGPQLIVLTRGVLPVGGDGRFSLAAENGAGAAAGWGHYQRQGDRLVLRPARWVTVIGGRPGYERVPRSARRSRKEDWSSIVSCSP